MTESTSPRTAPTRLLVTGATGFIGCRLAQHALRLGIDTLATGRAESTVEIARARELQQAKVPLVLGVLQDREFVRELVAGRTTVIHLAAAQHETDKDEAYFRAANVEGTRNLLEACAAAGAQRFVYGSTIGVYGAAGHRALDESSPVQPDNMYTRSKLEAEDVVRSFAQRVQTCIVRIPETYGPGDERLLKLFRGIALGRYMTIGAGTNRRQCLHVQDLGDALLLAAHHPAAVNQLFVLAGNEVLTTNEMVNLIATALGRPSPRARLPMWPFLAAARVMELTLPKLGVQPPLNTRRLDFFRKSFVFSTAKAQELLGFRPRIDFRHGAADTIAWYRARGLLPTASATELHPTETT